MARRVVGKRGCGGDSGGHGQRSDDRPGDILGYTAVSAGKSTNVVVKVSAIPAKMIAMLHVDKGSAGKFEFPGDDAPLMIDGKMVSAAFSTMAH